MKLISELQTRISTHELRVSAVSGYSGLVTEPTSHQSSLTCAPNMLPQHSLFNVLPLHALSGEAANAAELDTPTQADDTRNPSFCAQDTDMAAQRQKLEQAVDAWRRDAEHWRARYESLATPGVARHPVAVVAVAAPWLALNIPFCASFPAPHPDWTCAQRDALPWLNMCRDNYSRDCGVRSRCLRLGRQSCPASCAVPVPEHPPADIIDAKGDVVMPDSQQPGGGASVGYCYFAEIFWQLYSLKFQGVSSN